MQIAFTIIAEGIRLVTKIIEDQERKDGNPDGLSKEALYVFKSFKAAYDDCNIRKLSQVISASYSGNFYGASDKSALLEFFKDAFSQVPFGLSPKLQITVHNILEDSPAGFRCLVDFNSRLTVLGLPVAQFDSGLLVCEARPEGNHKIWKLTKLDFA